MEEVRKQLKKLQFSLLTQKRYFYYYIAKHIPVYYLQGDKKITVTPKGIVLHTPNIELDEFIIAMHGFVSRWPQRRKEFVEKHGFMSDMAFDLVASLKASTEADIEIKLDLTRVGINKERLRRNSVESLARELLPNINAIPFMIGVAFGKEKGQKSEEKGGSQGAGQGGEGENQDGNEKDENNTADENEDENRKGCLGMPMGVGGCCGGDNKDGEQQQPNNDDNGGGEGENISDEDGDIPVEIQAGSKGENGDVNLPQIVSDAVNYDNMLTAGRGLGADRILNELMRPKINIWRLINAKISQGIRKTRRTWRRLNRKLPMIRPGREYCGSDAMIILDSSGSIDEITYKKFAGIIEQLMRRGGRFRVISFSDGYIDHGINPQMKKLKTKSGGTYPQCLIPVITKEKPQMVVMLTDGDWFGDYKSFLNVIKKVPDSILITTYYKHKEFKKVFKIEGY